MAPMVFKTSDDLLAPLILPSLLVQVAMYGVNGIISQAVREDLSGVSGPRPFLLNE
jgi:hypothetical protein